MRLPRTFQVLAMTGWENGFFFYVGIWVEVKNIPLFKKIER
jgi:hypothetical protein